MTRSRLLTLTRLFGMLGVATALVGCGDLQGEESTIAVSAAFAEGYVGDKGSPRDPAEVDPTESAGFSINRRVVNEAPDRIVLDFRWYGQPNGYWCGPGAMRIALGTRIPSPPTQPVLAEFLGTTTEGTARADMIRALNQWLAPVVPYESIPVDGRPTQAQRDLLKHNLVWRLNTGFPFIANVLSGWRPPGYPSGTIGHFVAVVGYEDRGEKVFIADPAAEGSAGPRWENVPRTYWISLQNLGTWIGGRGYSGGAPR